MAPIVSARLILGNVHWIRLVSAGLALVTLGAPVGRAGPLTPVIGTTFSGLNFNQGIGLVPSDMAMAVGPTQIVQVVNGGYQVFSKSGAALSIAISDQAFWNNSGIVDTGFGRTNPNNPPDLVFDPRVVYDSGSQRFFVSEENFGDSTSNDILLGISRTSNPTDGFRALGFVGDTGFTNGFADFPTLGLDQNGVYIGTNNFDNSSSANSTSIFSLPKADLLLATPSIANGSEFVGLDPSVYGFVPNAVLDSGGAHGAVLSLGFNVNEATLAFLSGTSGASPTLSGATLISGLTDGATLPPRQTGGSTVTSNIDHRFSATSVAVGNLLYATNSIGDATHDMIHWMILDLTTRLVLQQGTFDDPNFDYTYPSIAANANGDFVIGFNRSGPTDDMSAYAVSCHFDGTNGECGAPIQLAHGLAPSADGRWGDYSVTTIDPSNPNRFWTALGVTAADGSWSTQITEIQLVPEPAAATLFAGGALLLFVLARRRGALLLRVRD